MVIAAPPTLAGFLVFIRKQMQIPVLYLPDNDPVIEMAYDVALALVNQQINQAVPLIYTLAVYNLGGDNIINFAQDQDGQTYFAGLRDDFGIYSFVSGVIASSFDDGTGESILNPDFMKQFTMSDLQNLKTPWGRQYLAFAQKVGTMWGVT